MTRPTSINSKKIKSGGYSLIELMIATGILAVVGLGVAQALSFYFQDYSRAKITMARDRFLNTLVSTIEVRLAQMDVSFNSTSSLSKDVSTFPYYWSAETVEWMTKDECLKVVATGQTCHLKGRLNYLIKPVPGVPSMYETTIYFYHPELNGGQVRVYNYFLAAK
jgi:type II secretory pathway pseudopilin PulG